MKKLMVVSVAAVLLAWAGQARADSCDSPWRDYWQSRHSRSGYGSREPRSYYFGTTRHSRVWDCRPPEERTVIIYKEPESAPVYPVSYAGNSGDTLVINIPNRNGSYTPVTVRRRGGVYLGPRGEQYLTVPTVDQLKPVYGLDAAAQSS